jgi:hypothetical protein
MKKVLSRTFNSSSSIGKKVKYGLGEILLIVTGILVAVWINNLNEARKDEKLASVYIRSLRQDLQKDSLAIVRSVASIRREIDLYEERKALLTDPSADLEDLLKIARYEFSPIAVSLPPFHNNTFKSMGSSGHMDLLPVWLSEALFELDNRQELARNIERIVDDLYYKGASDYGKKFPLSVHMINEGPIADAIWENVNYVELAAAFNNFASLRNNKHIYELYELGQVQDQVNYILKELRSRE